MLLRRSCMRHYENRMHRPVEKINSKLHVKEYLAVSTVTFFLLATDKEDTRNRFICKLAGIHCYDNLQTHILVPSQEHLMQLDEMLWEYPTERFVPHVVLSARSDKCLVTLGHEDQYDGSGEVLINTTCVVPDISSQFRKICEVVLTAERPQARDLYRQYRSRDYELFHEEHDEESVIQASTTPTELEQT